MITSSSYYGGNEAYGYAPDNKRVYKKKTDSSEEIAFYLGNRRLGTYSIIDYVDGQGNVVLELQGTEFTYWFGGKAWYQMRSPGHG